MNSHQKQKANKERTKLLDKFIKKYNTLGINEGLLTVNYTIISVEYNHLFTRFFIDHNKFVLHYFCDFLLCIQL